MSRSICWIDDSVGNMLNVVHGLFPKLWQVNNDNGIETRIVILGNAYQATSDEKGWSTDAEEELRNKIDEYFFELCENEDGIIDGNTTYIKKKHLIENSVKIAFAEEGKETIRKLLDFWTDENKIEAYKENRTEWEKTEIMEELMRKTGVLDADSIAIDVVLLNGDRERVTKKENPIFSMALYHYLREEKKKPCFLYSSFTFDRSFIESWKKCYETIYQGEPPRIFRRTEFTPTEVKDSVVNEVIEIIQRQVD